MKKLRSSSTSYRWLVYILILVAYIIGAFQKMSLQALKADMEGLFGIDAIQYSNLNAAYFYGYAITQIPAGILADVWGPKRTSVSGSILMTIGTVIYALAHQPGVLIFARLLVGLGSGVMFVCLMKVQSLWYKESEFGTLTGVTSLSGNMAGAFAQAPLAALVALAGWRLSFGGLAVITAVFAVLAIIFCKDRPEDMGFEPVSSLAAKPEKVSVLEGLKAVFTCPYVLPLFVIATVCNGIYTVMTTWAVPYMSDVYGLTSDGASRITFFMPLVAAFTNIATGWLTDKLKLRKVISVVLAFVELMVYVLICFAFDGKPPFAVMVALVMITGMSIFHAANYGAAKDCLDYKYSGMVISVVNTGCFIGGAVFTSMFGNIINRDLETLGAQAAYKNAFMVNLICFAFCLLASLLMLETNGINRSKGLADGSYKKSVLKLF